MRRGHLMLLALVAVLAFPATASAAPVLVLGRHDRVHRRNDPYLNGPALTPVPSITASSAARSPLAARPDTSGGVPLPGAGASRNRPPKNKKKKKVVTVRSVLAGLARRGRISPAQEHQALQAFDAALATERTLSGTRRAELSSVTTTIHQIAAEGQLWPSRLPLVEATLNANRQWWAHGTLLSYGQRVMFSGSELEWQYYPGQGIQLQELGSFGAANGMWQAGQITQLTQLLSELIPLATGRGGGLTWEYLFSFDGGSPPWTSAMSQATALQALSHAYQATHDDSYLTTAARALTIFTKTPAQNGVMVPTPRGVRFVQYTFTPGTPILNAFLQSLIGLDTYAQVSGNPTAAQLFAEGNAEALWEVPRFNTGAWSLYQPGVEDDLSYHELVTGFLQKLCALTGAATYCTTASAFSTDLKIPPAITALTHRARARRPFALRFRLSKISKVGITVRRGPRVIEATSATFPYGVQSISVPRLPPGAYTVTLTATDLAGNYTRDPASALTVRR
ncbi:MAG TPA: D-glucuronyl C5-epimerase family protein [Solirubrobacteraceae bacterium]|nr:D-glucuronyl C5-epimerase family protein [Solirubrobacteraceae bacterium]